VELVNALLAAVLVAVTWYAVVRLLDRSAPALRRAHRTDHAGVR
jgi:hypothetical protein